jgi:hypothetical protein
LHCEERGNVKIHHLSPRRHSRERILASTTQRRAAQRGRELQWRRVTAKHDAGEQARSGTARRQASEREWHSATAGKRERGVAQRDGRRARAQGVDEHLHRYLQFLPTGRTSLRLLAHEGPAPSGDPP